jgi:peptidoglycan/LPS O-acetylase OafA/YrhL
MLQSNAYPASAADSASVRTQSGELARLPSLDGLRAVAVLMVLWGHGGHTQGFPDGVAPFTPYMPDGKFGVRIFFVISGFIITHLLIRELTQTRNIDLKGFYVRRCLRLLPALGAYLMFVGMVDLTTSLDETLLGWATSLTFTKNFYAPTWISGHLWSLAVEEQFYLFWPAIVAMFGALRRVRLALVLIIAAPISRYVLHATGHPGFANVSFFSNMDFLMMGAVLGMANGEGSLLRALTNRRTLVLCSAPLIALAAYAIEKRSSLRPLDLAIMPSLEALAIGMTMICLVSLRQGAVFDVLNARPMVYLGRISYSLYLWQQALLVEHLYYGRDVPVILRFPINIMVALIVATISYELIEKPFLRLKRPALQRS